MIFFGQYIYILKNDIHNQGWWRQLDGKFVLARKVMSCAQTQASTWSSRGTNLNWAKPTYLLKNIFLEQQQAGV
jgi:hypothetical protein